MCSLTTLEKMKIERLFGMSSGYVLDFSNRTFHEFILEITGIDVYQPEYAASGESKANRLRTLWKLEPDHLNGLLLDALVDRLETNHMINGTELPPSDKTLSAEVRRIADRLKSGLDGSDVSEIRPIGQQKEFDILARSVRESILKNEPEAALDRLHTYLTKYMRERCQRLSIKFLPTHPLHSLLGAYLKGLGEKDIIVTKMTERILKSSISVLEAFNDIRNDSSLAHDNALLEKAESLFLFKSISNIVQLVDEIDPISDS